MTPPIALWAWSKDAVKSFLTAAAHPVRPQQFDIRRGLDAALASDLEGMVPAMAKMWVDIMTGPMFKPRTLRLVGKRPDGETVTTETPITKQLLTDLLLLDPSIGGGGGGGGGG